LATDLASSAAREAWLCQAVIRITEQLEVLNTKKIPELERQLQSFSPRLLNTKAACQYLNIKRTLLYELMNAELIRPEHRTGSKNQFSRVHLDNFLAIPAHEVRAKREEYRLRKAEVSSKAQRTSAHQSNPHLNPLRP